MTAPAPFRIAINGYGRIGQCVLRALYENGFRDHLQVVAINELSDIDTIAHLTRYDSTHGRFSGSIAVEGQDLIINGDPIRVLRHADRIVAAGSCTTNCLVPVITVLDKAFGVEQGSTTTIHAAMNDQPVIDAYHHQDLRLTRSALHNIVPVDTGLARGVERLLPHMEGRFSSVALRVPTMNVSAIDMVFNVRQDTDVASVNRVIKEAASGPLKGILGYTDELLASSDFNHDSHSGVVDGGQTRVTRGTMVKVLCWFDNEWGFANRMLDVSQSWLQRVV